MSPAAAWADPSLASPGRTPHISVRHVRKKFAKSLALSLQYGLRDIGRELLLGRSGRDKLRNSEFWAVDDVSFEVGPGDALGIIGVNGSGKSTLLKMLCGLLKPDAGEIQVNGRIGSLVELGSGFDPLLSGRENVYVNAAILGMHREQVDEILPRIIEFSGLREFMESPLKFYSSGMRSRLAYAVAIHLAPDVFVVDEVLAVGDIEFQRKCVRSMLDYVAGGGALLLVSHAAHHIQTLCTQGLVMNRGRVHFHGEVTPALDEYCKLSQTQPEPHQPVNDAAAPVQATGAHIDSVNIFPEGAAAEIRTGTAVRILIRCRCFEPLELYAGFSIWTRDMSFCVTADENGELHKLPTGEHVLACTLPSLPLAPGTYLLCALLREGAQRITVAHLGWHQPALTFTVNSPPSRASVEGQIFQQLIKIETQWQP